MDLVSLLRQLRFLNAAVKDLVPQEQATQLFMETERTTIDTVDIQSPSNVPIRTVPNPLSVVKNQL